MPKLLTVSVRMSNFDVLFKLFDKITEQLMKSVGRESQWLAKHIQTQYLSGGSGALKAVSGELRRRTFALAPIKTPDGVMGRVVIGSGLDYTHVHVGPMGKTTVIKPKTAKSLAIPLSSALTSAGGLFSIFSKGKSLWSLHPKLFRGSKEHNLRPDMLYYKRGKNEITPMFVLRRSVTLRTKVWPEQIAMNQSPFIRDNILSDLAVLTSRLA